MSLQGEEFDLKNTQGKRVGNPLEEMKRMDVYIQFLQIIAEGVIK